ncbi:hypothetical protein [Saccharopolyspora sp. NPDC002376]
MAADSALLAALAERQSNPAVTSRLDTLIQQREWLWTVNARAIAGQIDTTSEEAAVALSNVEAEIARRIGEHPEEVARPVSVASAGAGEHWVVDAAGRELLECSKHGLAKLAKDAMNSGKVA